MVNSQKKSIKTIMIIILLFFIVFSASLPLSFAKTIIIDNENGDFSNIQHAINSALDGDIILIQNGEYFESIWINKSLIIKGESKGNTILTSFNQTTINVNADNVTLYNLTIMDSKTGLNIHASNCILFNSTFLENEQSIVISNSSQFNRIYHTNFIENQINVIDYSNTTIWHKNLHGNYWFDYNGGDADNDGIGDTPYMISENHSDVYPSMQPFTLTPDADFYVQPLNPTTQDKISFTDISSDGDGFIVNWSWDFDDNTISYMQSPTHQYVDNGTYLVALTVVDDLGAINTEIYPIVVLNVGPKVSFTVSPFQPLTIQTVSFEDESTDPDGHIINRTWRINDTIVSNDASFKYNFPDSGEYEISLQVTDDDLFVETETKTILVMNSAPIAGFSIVSDTEEYTKQDDIKFQDNSYDADGTIVSWNWDFGDEQTAKNQNPTHSYSMDGVYKISLVVEDDDGATDTYSRSIRVGKQVEVPDIISGLSLFDIVIVAVLFIMVFIVIIVSKKYA